MYECVIMSTNMNESCHTYKWVLRHKWTHHVTHINESFHTCRWVTTHVCMRHVTHINESWYTYGVATVSRINKIVGLFCRIWSLLYASFAKEPYNLIDPTNQSHPIWMSQVALMDESCHTCEWVSSHIRMDHVHTYKWVMSHVWISHLTRMDEPCPHIWMSHVTRMNESRHHVHTHEWVTSSCPHTWMSHVTHMVWYTHEWVITLIDESYHTYELVSSHIRMNHVTIWMSHVTRMNKSCHT